MTGYRQVFMQNRNALSQSARQVLPLPQGAAHDFQLLLQASLQACHLGEPVIALASPLGFGAGGALGTVDGGGT